MVKFLNVALPGYKPPDRHTITIRLAKKYKNYRNQLAEYLKLIKHLALTTDMYKNKHLVYFLGLTLHFFDDDFNFVSLIIGFRKFSGRHQADRLSKFIQDELNKLKISNQIVATTADNAADIVKALKNELFGVRFSCFCHNLNLTLKNLVKQVKSTQSNECNLELSSKSDSEYEAESETESETENPCKDKQFELNNLGYDTDDFEEDSEDESLNDSTAPVEIIQQVQQLLTRIRSLVKMVRKCGNICSYATKKIQEDENLSNIINFIIDFHVRWNSTYLMLKRLVKLKDIVNNMTRRPSRINGITRKQTTKMSKLDLTEDDWLIVDILVKVLEPFFDATKMLSARKYATLSCSFVVRKVLLNSLKSVSLNEKEKQIKAAILTQFNYHLYEKTNITKKQEEIILVNIFFKLFFVPYVV
jgi:hypothetical protein